MNQGYFNPKPTGTVITIEKTGKGLKLQGVLSILLLLASIAFIIVGNLHGQQRPRFVIYGALGFVFSLVWMVAIRIKIWWRHG